MPVWPQTCPSLSRRSQYHRRQAATTPIAAPAHGGFFCLHRPIVPAHTASRPHGPPSPTDAGLPQKTPASATRSRSTIPPPASASVAAAPIPACADAYCRPRTDYPGHHGLFPASGNRQGSRGHLGLGTTAPNSGRWNVITRERQHPQVQSDELRFAVLSPDRDTSWRTTP